MDSCRLDRRRFGFVAVAVLVTALVGALPQGPAETRPAHAESRKGHSTRRRVVACSPFAR